MSCSPANLSITVGKSVKTHRPIPDKAQKVKPRDLRVSLHMVFIISGAEDRTVHLLWWMGSRHLCPLQILRVGEAFRLPPHQGGRKAAPLLAHPGLSQAHSRSGRHLLRHGVGILEPRGPQVSQAQGDRWCALLNMLMAASTVTPAPACQYPRWSPSFPQSHCLSGASGATPEAGCDGYKFHASL